MGEPRDKRTGQLDRSASQETVDSPSLRVGGVTWMLSEIKDVKTGPFERYPSNIWDL